MKKLLLAASMCSLFIFAGCGSTTSVPTQTTPTQTVTPTPTKTVAPPSTTKMPTGYTMQDVQQHNTASDCWTVINWKIYNMSSFASRHSGGANPIISTCGKDGTSVYTKQHGGSASLLQNFFVADLQ